MWHEISFQAQGELADLFSELLTSLGAVSVTFQDAENTEIFEPKPETTPLWEKIIVKALFTEETDINLIIEQLKAILGNEFIKNYSHQIIEDRDWQSKLKQEFTSKRFGKRLWVYPSWDNPPTDHEAVTIKLDPGLAFGTGSHPTTQLCLTWLDQASLKDKVVVDYGCGSGILAIAALKLGAKHVIAIDHNAHALEATLENANNNGIFTDNLSVYLPEEVQLEPTADILIANIILNPLIELIPTFQSLLKPHGEIVLSGILNNQVELLKEAYTPWCEFDLMSQEDGWVILHGIRGNP